MILIFFVMEVCLVSNQYQDWIVEMTALYGTAIFQDPDRLAQLIENYNSGEDELNFVFVNTIRTLLKHDWTPYCEYSDIDFREFKKIISDELGYLDEKVDYVFEMIKFISSLEKDEKSDDDFNLFCAKPGTLKKIDGGMGSRPATMWLRKKVISNSFLFIASMAIIVILFMQIGLQREPVGNEYRIAFFDVLSGAHASRGYNRLRGAQLAIEKMNEFNADKGYRYRIIGFDTPENPDAAADYVRNVMKDKSLLVMVSGMDCDVIEKIASVADELETPLVVTTADVTEDVLLNGSRPYLYTFSLATDLETRAKFLAYFATQGLRRKKVGILYDSKDSFAKKEHDAFLRWLKIFDGDVNVDIAFEYSNKKSLAFLTGAIKESGSDLLVLLSSNAAQKIIVPVARDSGYMGAILGENYEDNVEPTLLKKFKNTWWVNEFTTFDVRVSSLMRAYKKTYNEWCPQWDIKPVTLTYEGVYWLACSLMKAHGYRGESVRHALLATSDFYLPDGIITIDPRTHQPVNRGMSVIFCDGGRGSLQKIVHVEKK